jgi:tetratricopeptide (TPR) repeat protein
MITGAQRKALIVGISDYTSLQKLDFCKNDGTEVYEVLRSLGYEISNRNKLVGEAKGEKLRDAIYDFFDDKRNNLDDTLVFYYSGHGVPDADGEMYLASSDTEPDKPYRRGFSFEELRKRMENTIATKVVVILDCCYSGSAKISKGNEEDVAKLGRLILEQKSRKLLEGQGKYILSSSQSHQEAYALTTGEHSIFTYYLLKGLRGNTESIDSEGNVTPQSLGNYVIRAIMGLPPDERPRQRPMIKTEESGNVILASYPELRPPQSPSPITLAIAQEVRKGFLRSKTKISIAVGIAAIVAVVITLALFNQQTLSSNKYSLDDKGNALNNLGNYTAAIAYLDKALAIDPKFQDALNDKGWALNGLGHYTAAIPYLDKALAIDPNNEATLNFKGWALDGLGNYTEAIAYLDKALAIDPTDKFALNNKGWALNGLGNYTGALTYVDKALAIDPSYKFALKNKGWALNGLGNYTGALTYLDKALAIDPVNRKDINYKLPPSKYGETLTNKGWALNGLGNYKEAITYLDKALAINPDDKDALKNKAWALYGLGNYTGALTYLDKL